jgi:flagellar biosynthesis protein FliR
MRLADLATEGLRLAPYIMLVSLRVGILFSMLPAPFGEVAPVRIRAVLGFVSAFAISIPTLGNAHGLSTEPAVLLIGSLTELMVGAVMGLTVRTALAAADTAGTLAGNAMGLGFANQIDPLFGGEGVPTSAIMNSLAVMIFFVLNGHHVVLQALSASLTLAPPGGGVPTFALDELVTLGSRIVAQGLRIASPVVATMFIVQLGLALVARAAPRVQIFALSFGVTVTIGALILVMSAPQLAQTIGATIATIPDSLAQVMPGAAR